MKVYYLVYKLTNLVNGKIYIGCHMTQDVNDGYMGSGKRLSYAKKKYGVKNFKKEVLSTHESPEDMLSEEARLVNEEFLGRTDVYNLACGGKGGWFYINSKLSPDEKLKRRKAGGSVAGKLTGHQNHWKTKRLLMLNISSKGITAAASTEAVAKRIETFRKIGHQKGELNSQFGKRWMNKEGNVVRVSEAEASQLETVGWKRGKK